MTEKKGFFDFLSKLTGKRTSTVVSTFAPTPHTDTSAQGFKIAEDFPLSATDSVSFIPESKPPIPLEVITYTQEKMAELLSLSGYGGVLELTLSTPEKLCFNIGQCEDVGRVIGKDGATLEAYQILLRAFIFKKFGLNPRISLDIESYRKKREDMLKFQALKAAKMVAIKGKKMDLKPMNPEERRLIHSMFQYDKKIRSYSVGDGLYRHIVLERRSSSSSR
jgi:predicted RNA-binding protein Jag